MRRHPPDEEISMAVVFAGIEAFLVRFR